MGHSHAGQQAPDQAFRVDLEPLPLSGQSTGSLVVELSQLEYAVRACARRDPRGPEPPDRGDFRFLMLRKHAVLRVLRDRGLSFAEGSFDYPLQRQDAVAAGGALFSAGEAPVADEAAEAAQTIEQLERALVTRGVIGQALGILMERHKITAEEAFVVLRTASSVTNRKLSCIAADLAATGALPGPG